MKKPASTATTATIAAILAVLGGCASQPPVPRYTAAEDAPTANLKSDIWGATSRRESIDVYVREGQCGEGPRKKLFYIHESKSFPAGDVKVAANQPLRLEYVETASGNRSCQISLDVNLEAGKNYSLLGGFAYKSGPIPIFTGTRMCRFAVQDDADKTVVSHKPACPR